MKKIFKKGLSALMSATILMSSGMMATTVSAATNSGSENYTLGDVDGNGKINVDDINKLQDYLCGDYKPSSNSLASFLKAADINEDGQVDNKDVDTFVDAFIYADSHLGDVDGDGRVTIFDSSCIQKYLADMEKFDINSVLAADFYQNNAISVVDATEIQKKSIGMGKYSSFPTAAVKADDKKYRKEYADDIDEIETDPRSNISFDKLREKGVYVVKRPQDTSGVFVRDKKWCYNILSSGEIWLWGCYSKNDTLVLPTELSGYNVTGVSEFFSHEDCFPNSDTEKTTINSIKTLIIPNTDGYREFKNRCFSNLTSLETVILQEGVTFNHNEGEIFYKCKKLKNIIWPDSMTIIPQGFFMHCTNIKSIEQLHLPESVNKIDIQAFLGSGLEQITIPENITTIKQGAFIGVPARTATFEHKKLFEMDIFSDAFRVWGDGDVDKKLEFIGHKNSAYQFFVNNKIADYQIMINLGIINSMDAMPYVFNYFEDK